jgi:competence protein ComEC
LFLRPAEWILCCYEWICTLAQQLPNAVWIIGKPALWQILLYYVLLCTGLYLCKEYLQKEREQAQKCRQWLKPIYGLCSILILLSILIIPVKIACAARTTVTMLDVGQGDCFCVQLKGTVFMIDAGSSSETEIAKYKIEPFLKSQGIDKVDYMMASHADKDHINGLSECLSNSLKSGITYEHLVLTKYAADCREEYTELLRAAEKAGCEVMFIAKGDSFRIGEDIELTCLHPLKGAVYGEQNDSSMVLLLECMDTSMLFTGDISQKEEAAVVEALEQYRKNTHVDYLKTAHHGSKYSTSADFLKRVSPEYAFISCGKENRYGHPHEELIFRLQDSGCELFLTPESGAVERRLDVNNKGSHS